MKQTIILLTILLLGACKQTADVYHQTAGPNDSSAQSVDGNNHDTNDSTQDSANDIAASDSNATTAPVKTKINFSFATKVEELAHDKAVKWDGCSKNAFVKGGYDSDTTCGKAYIHYPKFAQHLDKYFYTCVADAAKLIGFNKPENIFINHMGTYNDRDARGSNTLSMHAYARAIDIAYLNITDASGKKIRISSNVRDYKGINKKFYDEFRQCWKETMPKSCEKGGSESIGSIGIPSSALGGNSLHNDHIHLSFPKCAG